MRTKKENTTQKRRKRRKAPLGLEQLLFVVALTFANQICDINSTPIHLQQQRAQLTSGEPALSMPAAAAAADSKEPAANKVPPQRFRLKPEPLVTLTEGNTILLRCEVDNQAGDAQWLKDNAFVFHANRTPAHSLSSERRNIVGSVERGEHNLELVNAQLDDSGTYECQVQPSSDEAGDELRAQVQVIVRPQSQQLDLKPQTRAGTGSATDPISLTKLPRGATSTSSAAAVAASSSSSAQFLTHQHQHQHQHQQQQQPQLQSNRASHLLGWPYVLLALAGLLMLVNIYLVYSLVKRHQQNQKANSKCAEGSLASSTVASSGSPLVSSSQSTESAATTSTTATTTGPTSSQQQQLLQFQLNQQQLQLQLQQQLHQLRPPISDCYEPQRLRIRPDSSLRV